MPHSRIVALGTLCILAAGVGLARAENWPRFRGPNGTGVAKDKDIPVHWTAGGDGILWKTPLPGAGNSSPIVWGDRIFVQSAPSANERQLLCLNAADGKVIWATPVPGTKAATHAKNTLASSTPATDGQRVYALFWDGTHVALHAFDFAGKPLWKYDLGTFTSQHGPGASPVVYDGIVYLNNDQDKFKDPKEQKTGFPGRTSQLVAVDAATGKPLWKSPRTTYRACYSTPFLYTPPDGAPELIVASTAGITGYHPKTGAETWKWTWAFSRSPLRTVGSPVFADGLVVACSGDGSGERHMVAVRKGDKGDVTGTNLIWATQRRDTPYVPTVLVSGEHLYYVNDQGFAFCVVAKTGKQVWSERLQGTTSASPVLIDGKVYATSEDGDTYIFPAAPTFQLLARNSLGEGVIATPAVADGRLYVRGKQHLFCIGKAKDR